MEKRRLVTFSDAMALPKIGVAVRVRPPDTKPARLQTAIKGQFGHYEFDSVHDENAMQEEVYRETFQPVVNTFLQGIDCTVILYGGAQTGKSFTLEGIGKPGAGREGVIPRTLDTIMKHLAIVPRHRYKVYITYSGITVGYDANLVDLLVPGCAAVSLKEISASSALERLLQHPVESLDDVHEALRRGRVVKAMGTSGKATSKPGAPLHSMLTVHLVGQSSIGSSITSKLSFVELVSPDYKDNTTTPTSDPGLSRALAVSYSSLTSVLVALKQSAHLTPKFAENGAFQHIPWRDSALTRWLKDPLSTAHVILMVACVAPGPEAANETLSTLNYVSRFRTPGKGQGIVVSPTWDDPTAAPQQDADSPQVQSWSPPPHTSQEFRPRSPASSCSPPPGSYSSPVRSPHQDMYRRSPSPHSLSPPRSAGPMNVSPSRSTSPPRRASSASPYPWHSLAEPDVAAYGELLTILKRSNGGLRAEALLEKLLQELGELRASGLADQGEARVLKATVQTLQEENGCLEAEAQRSSTIVQELRGQMDSLQQQLEAAASDRDRARARCEQLQGEVEPLSQQRHMHAVAADQASKELQALKEKSARVEAELQGHVSRLQAEADTHRTRSSQLQQQLAEQRQVSEDLLRDRQALQGHNSDLSEKLQQQVRNLSEEASHMKAKALEALKRADQEGTARRSLEAELQRVRMQVENEMHLKERLAAMGGDLNDAKNALETVREERARLQDMQWRVEEKLEQLSVELEATIMAKEQASSDLHKKTVTVDKLQCEVARLESKNQQMQKQLVQLEASLKDIERKESAASMYADEEHKKAVKYEATVTELKEHLSEFVKDLEDVVPLRMQHLLSASERRISPWQPVLTGAVAVIKKLTATNEEISQARQRADEELQSTQSHLAELQRSAASAKAHNEELLQEVQHLKHSIADRSTEVERLSADSQRTSSQHKVVQEKAGRLEEELEQVRGLERSRAIELQLKEEMVQLLSGEKDSLEAELRSLRGTAHHQHDELQDAKYQIHSRDQLLDQLHCELRTTMWLPGCRQPTEPPSPVATLRLRGITSPPESSMITTGGMPDWSRPEAQEPLVQSLINLKSEAARLQKEVVALQQEKEVADELAVQLQQAQQQLGALKLEGEELQQCRSDLRGANEGLQVQVQRLASQLEAAQTSLDEEKKARQSASDEAFISGRERDVLQDSNKQQETRIQELTSELDKRSNEAARAQAELKAAQLELTIAQDRVKTVEKQLADSQDALEAAQQVGATSQEAGERAAQQITKLSEQLQIAEDQARAAKIALQEGTDRWERKLQDMTAEEARLRADIERLRAEKLEAALKVEELNQQLDAASSRAQERDNLQRQLNESQKGQLKQADTVSQLQDSNQRAAEEGRALRQEVQRLSDELQRASQDVTNLVAERDNLRSQVEATRLDTMVAAARQRTRDRLSGALSRSSSISRGGLDNDVLDAEEAAAGGGLARLDSQVASLVTQPPMQYEGPPPRISSPAGIQRTVSMRSASVPVAATWQQQGAPVSSPALERALQRSATLGAAQAAAAANFQLRGSVSDAPSPTSSYNPPSAGYTPPGATPQTQSYIPRASQPDSDLPGREGGPMYRSGDAAAWVKATAVQDQRSDKSVGWASDLIPAVHIRVSPLDVDDHSAH